MKAVILLLSFFSMNAYAAVTWYYGLTIKDVRAQNKNNQTSFRTVEAVSNPGGCQNADYYGIRPENHPELGMSVLLAAYMSDRKVDVSVSHEECDAFGRPSITNVRIRN